MHKTTTLLLIVFLSLRLSGAEPIVPIPQKIDVDMRKVDLGKRLFFDPILSKDKTIACANCHDIATGGDDGLVHSFGINGSEGTINSPTVFNAHFNFRQFWDGRAKDLNEQAKGPITNPIEMGNDFESLITALEMSTYKDDFETLYRDGITQDNIIDALVEYEKTLITPDAPFDRYLRGEKDALSKDAKAGYALFKEKGCISCHHGINIGGNLYHKFGLFESAGSADLGRFNVTKDERDKYYFKVPSLRNVAMTAPYFHDGRSKDLTDAVKVMARYQLGRSLSDEEVRKIVAFLGSLSGRLPETSQ